MSLCLRIYLDNAFMACPRASCDLRANSEGKQYPNPRTNIAKADTEVYASALKVLLLLTKQRLHG